jgi:integrase
MGSVYRRVGKDGKLSANYSYEYVDATGRRRYGTGTADRTATKRIVERLESEARLVEAGLVDPKDDKAARAARRPIAEHVEDYRLALIDKGDTEKHAGEATRAILRLFESARVERLTDVDQEAVQAAVAKLKAARSARTANYALGACKAFLRWCSDVDRIKAEPKWLRTIKPYNEAVDQRRVRRSLTAAELETLLEKTATLGPVYRGARWGEDRYAISGAERSMLYRLAAATGLRANELRTLDASAFQLDGDDPRIVVRAGYSKHRREDRQPIRRADAAIFREWLASRDGAPVVAVPNYAAAVLADDLEACGIEPANEDGVVDFHALRATYITLLFESGADPKEVQKLARHSTITLTLDKYVKKTAQSLRTALEGEKEGKD